MKAEIRTAITPATTGWRRWWSGRRRYWIIAALVLVAGLALGWRWLAAIGALPLLLGFLTCGAMCGLGLCMNRMGGQSCNKTATTDKQ